ncbi:MAG: RHS repeat-associated core domain-containing protein, partial [Deltaproteobacteria bacterium]|nr:RHS repeat-associated core domain-containing protein [Deltaproteobacteria bacterium]
GTRRYEYDGDGLLLVAETSTGDTSQLVGTSLENGGEVLYVSPEGNETRYRTEDLEEAGTRLTRYFPGGPSSEVLVSKDGLTTDVTLADASRLHVEREADNRWAVLGLLSRYVSWLAIDSPGGRHFQQQRIRTGDPEGGFSEDLILNGDAFEIDYAAAERELRIQEPQGGRVRIVRLDEKGRPAYLKDGGMAEIRAEYDPQSGGIHRFILDDGTAPRVLVLDHDDNGYLASVTDPAGRTLSFQRDAAGRVLVETLPDGRRIGFAYDANGNPTEVQVPTGETHRAAYDARDRLASYTPPEGGATAFAYDRDGNPTELRRPDGLRAQWVYSQGRPDRLLVDTDTGTPWSADGARDANTAQLKSVTSSDGVDLTLFWDGFLRVGEAWDGAVSGWVRLAYDDLLRVNEMEVQGAFGTFYVYGPDGTLRGTTELDVTWDPQTRWTTGIDLDGVTTAIERNAFGERTLVTTEAGGSTLYRAGYQRDLLGRITVLTEEVQGESAEYRYEYDAAGRLTRVLRNGSVWAEYEYDANGNRTRTVDDRGERSASYTTGDRLASYGPATYEHGAWGQRTARTAAGQTTRYAYDALGRLRRVTLPDGTEIAYLYDGLGRRVGKRRDGALVQGFLYAGNRVVAEVGSDGSVRSVFVYATRANVPDYLVRDGVAYRIVADSRGSPRLVVNTRTNEVVQRIDYDPWGRVLQDTNPGFQPFGFAGGVYDPDTGLVHMGLRDYDPETGRFLARDPFLFAGGSANLYAYVLNDPVNYIDLWGTKDWLSKVADIAAGIGDAALSFVTLGLWKDAGSDIRRALGLERVVDPCSDLYQGARKGFDFTLGVVSLAAGGVKGDIDTVLEYGRRGVREFFQEKGWEEAGSFVVGWASGVTQSASSLAQ